MKKSTEHMLIAPAILTGIILLRKLFKAKQEVLKQDDKLQQDIEEFNAEHYETFDGDDGPQDIGRVKRRIYVEIEEAQRRGIPLGNKFDALTSINKADLKAIGEQFGWKQSSVSKASGKPYAEAYFGSLKRAYNAISGTTHVVKDEAGNTILTWRDSETAAEQEASRKRLEEIERDIAETRKRIRANRRKQIGIASREELEKHKQAQFNIIQSTNPMLDDIHTGIRSVEDILTLEETMIDRNLIVTEPDWGESDILNAIKTGIVTIYSSYPIDNGVFVTPSRMTAKDYAGGGKVYSKTVPINKVAWIYSDEGQYADVDTTTHTADVNMNSRGVGKVDHFSVLKSKQKTKESIQVL